MFEPKVRIPDADVLSILDGALALVYAPKLEPFGLAPLEANACDVPVVAVAEGGVRETVIDQVNGLLVDSDLAAIQLLRANPVVGPISAPPAVRRWRRNGCLSRRPSGWSGTFGISHAIGVSL